MIGGPLKGNIARLEATGKAGGYWRLQVGGDRLETRGWRQQARRRQARRRQAERFDVQAERFDV
jgi:hypothetical protein